MTKNKEIVQRINSNYVSDNCVQVMIPYLRGITILNKDGVLYHHIKNSDYHINKYLSDERRKMFPYNNIPTHFSKTLFSKIQYTNQILDYNEPYISVNDNNIIESFIVKDGNNALSVNKILSEVKETHILTREELESRLYPTNINEQVYYLKLDGSMFANNKYELIKEEEIYKHIKNGISTCITDLREYVKDYEKLENCAYYLKKNDYFLDFAERSINKLDINEYEWNLALNNGESLLLIKIEGDNITIEKVDIIFITNDKYKVDIYNIPVTKYTLEQIKYLSPKIKKAKEPKIPLSINPGITSKDIKETKRLIKK